MAKQITVTNIPLTQTLPTVNVQYSESSSISHLLAEDWAAFKVHEANLP